MGIRIAHPSIDIPANVLPTKKMFSMSNMLVHENANSLFFLTGKKDKLIDLTKGVGYKWNCGTDDWDIETAKVVQSLT